MKGTSYCYYHNPAISEEEKKQARVRGGKGNRNTVNAQLVTFKEDVKTPEGVKVLLETTVHELRGGVIDTDVARTTGYLCMQLLKAIEVSDTEKRIEELEKKVFQQQEVKLLN